jgi:hypothetical protein
MGVKLKRPLLIINSVRPGATATLEVPTDPRYFKIDLHISATGQVLNQIVDEFRIKIGTKDQRTVRPDFLDHAYLLMGENASTQYSVQNNVAGEQIDVPFWFMEPWRKSYAAQRAMAWPTGDIPDQGFIVEIDISDTADASVDITASASFDNPVDGGGNPMPMDQISKWYEEDVAVNGLTPTYKGLERVDNLQSLSFFDEGTIDKVEFIVGNVTVREILRQEAQSDLVGAGMTPHDDWFDIVFDDDDDPLSAMPLAGAKTVVVKLTLNDGTPTTIPLLVQRIGQRD